MKQLAALKNVFPPFLPKKTAGCSSLPCSQSPAVLHTELLLWKAAWICLDNTFILQRPGQQSACLGKAHTSALLNPWAPKPHHNLSGVLSCKTTPDLNRTNKAGQWGDEGAEMGSGGSFRGLAWLLGVQNILCCTSSSPSARLGLIAPLTASDSPEMPWTGMDTLWPALMHKGNHFPT